LPVTDVVVVDVRLPGAVVPDFVGLFVVGLDLTVVGVTTFVAPVVVVEGELTTCVVVGTGGSGTVTGGLVATAETVG
jgi:hypothetical protein